MGPIGEGRGWWVPRGGSDFLAPPLQNFSEALSRNFKDIYGILSSRAVDWHPCWENRLKWGVSRAAQSLTNGLSANSARMEDQDLKYPYCSKLCDNRLNRDRHVEACKKQRDTGKRAKHGQQSMFSFMQRAPAASASPMQAHATPMQAHSPEPASTATPPAAAAPPATPPSEAPAASPAGAAASEPMDAQTLFFAYSISQT